MLLTCSSDGIAIRPLFLGREIYEKLIVESDLRGTETTRTTVY